MSAPFIYLEDNMNRSETMPNVIKERVYASGGKLNYVTGTTNQYLTQATDVRFINLDKSMVAKADFVYAPGKKVSEIAAAAGADLAFNFPFFWQGMVLGDNKDHDLVISAAYNEQLNRHEFGFKGGQFVIGQLQDTLGFDFMVQGAPMLIDNGNQSWDWYRAQESVPDDIGKSRAQRTFVGTDADGNLLIGIADGRTVYDQGLTLEEMALYMKDKGAVNALNGDGGSSTALYLNGSIQNQNSGANEAVTNHAVLIWFKKDVAKDVPVGYPYADAIKYAIYNKLMSVDANGNFNPTQPVTREMLAQVLYNKK